VGETIEKDTLKSRKKYEKQLKEVGKITERDMRNNSEKYKKQLIAM
jgi:hypothetical protein